ncbi:hypothetical protein SVAN01_01768 [Stagonosporopsis vannaccii]|nr:hypothetical protein SVAN01_01768 [Stagonosporopsis vannaccii]
MNNRMGLPLWFMRLLVLFTLLPFAFALTRALPEGRLERIPGLKPLPLDNSTAFPVAKFALAGERRPRPKPGTPGIPSHDPQDVQGRLDGSMCGLDTPSKANWNANRDDIAQWFQKEFEDYKADPTYENIALFLRDRWAPTTVSSNLFCDSIGACNIASCKNLVDDDGTNRHDRQMALYVFEQLANAAHLFQAVEREFSGAIEKVLRRKNALIEDFSSAPRIEKALKNQLRREELTMQIFQALGLMVNGVFGIAGAAALPGAAMTAAATNMVVSTYIGVTGILHQLREPADIVTDVKEAFEADLNLAHDLTVESIKLDFHDLMIGAEDHLNRTVVDLMANSDFLEPAHDFMPKLGEHITRIVGGTAIDKLWEFDRSYFVLVENPGGCENDRTIYRRGPTEYLTCLPEHEELGFWFYSIDRSQEDDHWHNDQALVRGPTGFRRLNGNEKYFGITMEDVARSAYWVYKNDVIDINGRANFDPMNINQMIREPKVETRMLGVFTPAICFNPGGEAISGVLDKKGQNYPCMCGNFSWRSGWSFDKDESPKFMIRTKFSQSEDFEDACTHKNKCAKAKYIDIRAQLEAARKPGDPPIAKKIEHPYWKCEKRRDSFKHPGWPDRDMTNQAKRNRLDWAIHDENGRNGSRVVVGFEG